MLILVFYSGFLYFLFVFLFAFLLCISLKMLLGSLRKKDFTKTPADVTNRKTTMQRQSKSFVVQASLKKH